MNRARLVTVVLLVTPAVATTSAGWARADVVLPAIFGSNMVLPGNRKLPVWGTASPGEAVTVSARGQSAKATADGKGRWRVDLPAASSTTPFEIVVEGKNRVVLSNVVEGDVWLASGQSNMEWPLYASEGADAEIHNPPAALSALRIFTVRRPSPEALAREPSPARGRWSLVSADNLPRFSAVAYHFARTVLDQRRGKPLGIVHASWGGSRAETWVPRAVLRHQPRFAEAARALDQGLPETQLLAARAELRAWEDARTAGDPGDRGVGAGYARIARDGVPPPGFRRYADPGPPRIESALGRAFDGVVWFRTEIALPSGFVGQPAFLRLGSIDQCDTTYVEGALVGATCEPSVMAPESYPRGYKIPAALTRRGHLGIAVRVWDPAGAGGFLGPPAALRLASQGPEGPSVALAGPWWWKVESESAPRVAGPPRPTLPAGFPQYQGPGVLWDNMIADLAPFPFSGVLWYQGESNTKEAFAYRTLLPTLMTSWRRAFESPALPFLLVQLAAHHPAWPGAGQNSSEEWAELREAQAEVAARDPASGLAVTIDLGARDDIHPRNKREVGRRLGLLALAQVYKEPVIASGPVYLGHVVDKDGGMTVKFRHAAGLAQASGSRLVGFELAGGDRQFVAADARIEGETVRLSAPGLSRPVAVRYAWGDDPACNLVNFAALPAVPFRSDRWPRFSQRRSSAPSPAVVRP